MDRGAARSRKRSGKAERPAAATATAGIHTPNPAGPSSTPHNRPHSFNDRPKKPLPPHGRPHREPKPPREAQSKDPSLYVAKAVRTAAALHYAQEPFPIPPGREVLANVRRVDLSGSGVTDVSWLRGTGVTWLSVADCPIESGWDAIGTLQDLAVLNISRCGLGSLPKELGALKKLKAVVAMGNDWTELDPQVMANWTELNSLIISHSANLVAVPRALSTLYQLSKLTFSHCPRLTVQSLPDLSALPLLRDVKMNNLPQLTSLPPHIVSWGTGDMSTALAIRAAHTHDHDEAEAGPSTSSAAARKLGDGLEVLDLGNCSLSFEAAAPIFGLARKLQTTNPSSKHKHKTSWPHLRSLSLHSNPLGITHPDYLDLLQASVELPNLQIIDTKRVKERKRKGLVQESKEERKARERRARKMQPTGANVGGGKMRSWGQGAEAGVEATGDAGSGPVSVAEEPGNRRNAHSASGTVTAGKKRKAEKNAAGEESVGVRGVGVGAGVGKGEDRGEMAGEDTSERPAKRAKPDISQGKIRTDKAGRKLKHRQASPSESAPVLIIQPDKYRKTPLTSSKAKDRGNDRAKDRASERAKDRDHDGARAGSSSLAAAPRAATTAAAGTVPNIRAGATPTTTTTTTTTTATATGAAASRVGSGFGSGSTSATADPSILARSSKGKTETAVVRVIEVARPGSESTSTSTSTSTDPNRRRGKNRKSEPPAAEYPPSGRGGGVDLKAVFAKPTTNDSGLGVGGW